MLDLLIASPLLAGGVVFVLGLCIGSFLNVVIYRLPVIMERQWHNECANLHQQPPKYTDKFNLATPASRCPHFWPNRQNAHGFSINMGRDCTNHD